MIKIMQIPGSTLRLKCLILQVRRVAGHRCRTDDATRKQKRSRSVQVEKWTTRHQTTDSAPQLPGW